MLELVEPRPPLTATDLERRLELRLIDRDGRTRPVSLDGQRMHGFHAAASWRPMLPSAGIDVAYEVELTVVSHHRHRALGLQIALALDAPASRFMIPGLVYGENRSADCRLRYPRVVLEDAPVTDALSSHRWGFRADRSSHGAVLGWTADACLALATDERSGLGVSGLGFAGGAWSFLVLNFPAREEPVTYVGRDAPAAPEVETHDWEADEIAVLRFLAFVLPPEPHAYDAVLRCLYRRDRKRHSLNPWMPVDEASALAAHGLYRWHYRPDPGVLVETTAFHRDADEGAPVTGDRDAMHVAWLSGAPAAQALLKYGRAQDHPDYIDAAISVLDTIAAGIAPAGCFWGQWTRAGWDGGWNGHRDWIHSRTIGEATLFMIRAAHAEEALDVEHPLWQRAIESNLEFATSAQREDGAFPALVNGRTGAAVSWDGAAGLLWIPALIEGKGEQRAAELAGSYYARFIEDEFIFGAPEDIDRAPSSEDGYNAVIAYVSLFEATEDPRWLELARRATEWMLSFRWSYNLTFPEHTLLDSYDYRSRGSDLASPRNQHLHSYGLICLPELVRLSEHSGDGYYLDRAVDNLAASLQFIAREDGDFNARKGMVTERYYNSRCFGPKGAILAVSHAWSAGLVLYACQAGLSVHA